jgi:hypothetical protein
MPAHKTDANNPFDYEKYAYFAKPSEGLWEWMDGIGFLRWT